MSLFITAIFLSAGLLFSVQPLFARMALPLLGGSPSVWNTALVFYQTVLLAGYAYAHGISRCNTRMQTLAHLALLFLPLLFLPIRIPGTWIPPLETNPTASLLKLFALYVGVPFFVLSSSSPLLQKWFSITGERRASDPYFLYAASNLGSLLALVSYPFFMEPYLSLEKQSQLWALGYIGFLVLAGACAWRILTSPKHGSQASRHVSGVSLFSSQTASERCFWLLLSFIPSSLLMGVTTYISSDIVSMPLLWVIPLAIYLLAYALAFSPWEILPLPYLIRALPIALVALTLLWTMQATQPIVLLTLLHWLLFFIVAASALGVLAAQRPEAKYLTEFYLWLAVGGALGGVFNALIAPRIFTSVAEYPLALVLAGFFIRHPAQRQKLKSREVLLDLLGALGIAALIRMLASFVAKMGIGLQAPGLVFGPAALLCFLFSKRALRFGLGLGAMCLASNFYQGEHGRLLHAQRSFFGIHRVTLDSTSQYQMLVHGKIIHGMQSLDPLRRGEPLTYFHPTGPIGRLFAAYGPTLQKPIAVIGLGAGSLAAYGRKGQTWVFYEIDPAVAQIAQDERYFTFLKDSPAQIEIVLGDGRLSLAQAPSQKYGLILLDAYSSDAMPVHLMTLEALKLYLNKLAEHGILAFNISSQNLDLKPVLGKLASNLRLHSLYWEDVDISLQEYESGKRSSQWFVMARSASDMAQLSKDRRFRPYPLEDSAPLWTDNFTSLWKVFVWKRG